MKRTLISGLACLAFAALVSCVGRATIADEPAADVPPPAGPMTDAPQAPAAQQPLPQAPAAEAAPAEDPPAEIAWLTDYAQATQQAETEKKLLLIYFRGAGDNAIRDRFESKGLGDERVRTKLRDMVAAKLPLDYRIRVKGEVIRAIDHAAFSELRGQEGFSIIDYSRPESPFHGHVVTSIPFNRGKYYEFQAEHLKEVMLLPAGTLTQRTLILAVRIHPERPKSVHGEKDDNLLEEARSHSDHQARIGVQGHHQWESRFPRISRLLGGRLRASEVCAESWPHESLIDAAVDCVDCWRHSSGHWHAVSSPQVKFGYDMKRGRNGIWYATGIFGGR